MVNGLSNAIELSYIFKWHVVKFRFLRYPLMENTFHTSFLAKSYWYWNAFNDIYAFKLVFRKRFLSHVFLIYANSEDLGKAIKSEQVFSYNKNLILSSDGSGESVHWHRFAGACFGW